jgi:hypothetical protein
MKATKKRVGFIAAAMLLSLTPIGVSAQSRCPAGESGCTADNYSDRIKSIVGGETREFMGRGSTYERGEKAIQERGSGVRAILKKCVDCSMDAVKDARDKVFNGGGSGRITR